jgi:hypothetical protein
VQARLEGELLSVASTLPDDQTGVVTAPPLRLDRPSRDPRLGVSRSFTYFLEVDGRASHEDGLDLQVAQFHGGTRTRTRSYGFRPRTFRRIELAPDTDSIRLAIRVAGARTLEIDRLALHLLSSDP